ncbi:hypothetical protein T265_07345 [Opisthorchis viverrini]|uniref:Uncharacterized protein n=1 Tax=Opisthorchis viverrini TaxID=6198 RepID=A0A074ZP60_OPIVI|nr:hypothetical protein T265_07345 [Opisthorchis viverrini]KER25120.1 hypothetical protein T265_07345 [Opisthorchis viverrini]
MKFFQHTQFPYYPVVVFRYTKSQRYTHLQINLLFTGDSIEHLVYDVLQQNVLHTDRLMIQLTRYWRYRRRESTDRKARGSNPTSAFGLPLSRLGQSGSIPALVPPSGRVAVRRRKGVKAKRLFTGQIHTRLTILVRTPGFSLRWPKWLEREFTHQKVRDLNPTSASLLPLSKLGQPGSIPALVQPSGGMAVRHRKGATAERTNFLSQMNANAVIKAISSSVPIMGGLDSIGVDDPVDSIIDSISGDPNTAVT